MWASRLTMIKHRGREFAALGLKVWDMTLENLSASSDSHMRRIGRRGQAVAAVNTI
jgi:hypothetical protein